MTFFNESLKGGRENFLKYQLKNNKINIYLESQNIFF